MYAWILLEGEREQTFCSCAHATFSCGCIGMAAYASGIMQTRSIGINMEQHEKKVVELA